MSKKEKNKTNVMRILDRAKCPYTPHEYAHQEGDPVDGISVAAKLGQNINEVYKTLVCQAHSGNYCVFVIPVAQELDLKKAAKAVQEKSVAMIPVTHINQVTGYIRGGCSPIGMKKNYPTVLDATAKDITQMYVSAGKIGYQIQIAPKDLITFTKAHISDIIKAH